MQFLKFLYLWLAVLVFLEWYGRNFPALGPPEASRRPATATAGKGAPEPARESRGP